MAKKKQTFEEFTEQVNSLMKKDYALEPSDFDSPSESMKTAYQGGESPKEFVDWYAEKYDLDKTSTNRYGY